MATPEYKTTAIGPNKVARCAFYRRQAYADLQILQSSEFREGGGYAPAQEIFLNSRSELIQLRDFLNACIEASG